VKKGTDGDEEGLHGDGDEYVWAVAVVMMVVIAAG
jgi:hypothetical protein